MNAEAHWEPVQPFPFASVRRTFTGAAEKDPLVAIRYFRDGPQGPLVALARFSPKSEGAPGQVHGGAILTVLDEALGAAAWLEGHQVLTVRLNAEFRKSVPLEAELLVRTKIVRARHRLVFVEGELSLGGAVYARAEGEFLELDKERVRRFFRG